MSIGVTVSEGGSAPLVLATVKPFLRENMPARMSIVRVNDTSDNRVLLTGARLRFRHLIVPGSTSARRYIGGVKDYNDVWSEWSGFVSLTVANYVTGAGAASIGSGMDDDQEIEEPAARFPDLSMGTGLIDISRTLVSNGFYDETRRAKWDTPLAAFTVVANNLDQEQVLCLHRWYRALNGPMRPFVLDYKNVMTGEVRKYVVRLRDTHLADDLFGVDRSNLRFNLIECVGIGKGGDV